MLLIVVTGLAAEARIAVTTDAAMIVGAGRAERLAADLEIAIARGAKRLLSFGVAGALAPQLQAGDLIVAHGVRDGDDDFSCQPAWRVAMSRRLQRAGARRPGEDAAVLHEAPALFRPAQRGGWRPISDVLGESPFADIAGVDAPVAGALDKAALFAATGAVAVDMESMIVARAAERHALPFAILRVIADPAHRSLPSSALVAMRANGEVNVGGVLGALVRDPRQMGALMRLAGDARKAFSALAHAREILGPDFASLDQEFLRANWRDRPNPGFWAPNGEAGGRGAYAHEMA